ncbi:glycosyltransferase family 1 protein, partial [Rhizobium ruizarguesonis]
RPEALRYAASVGRFPGPGTTRIDRVVIIDDYSVARGGATALAVLSAKLFRGLDIPVTYICGDDAANVELVALGVSMV